MATLGHDRIESLLGERKLEDRLVITPLLSMDQIREASVDIRVNHEFIVTRRANLPYLDPQLSDLDRRRYQVKHAINRKQKFYLHPGELVLAGTLEYFRLPKTVSATVTSRSRWGRTGLVIATATAVHPGFAGTITLELINHGEVPLVLYPGISVAQIIFSDTRGATEYQGDLGTRTGAELASLHDDMEKGFWVGED